MSDADDTVIVPDPVTRPGADAAAEHAANTELLMAELPDQRFVSPRFLTWLYDANPFGPGIYEGIDDADGRRIAHYALIPQEYRDADGPAPFVFSLNAVTRSGAQRRGFFSEIGRRIWAEAGRRGVIGVIGVTNDKSKTPVERQGWRWMGRMPVLAVPPRPIRPGRFRSVDVTPGWLAGDEAAELLDGLDEFPATHWTNRWTLEHLRWRLAWPDCGPYAVHADDELVAISRVVPVGPIPVAVVLKLLPRHGRSGPISGWAAVSAACAHHRAPVAVYCGFNRHVVVRGWPAPERLKPAPLNLMIYSTSDELDQDHFALDTYELLDMDAY